MLNSSPSDYSLICSCSLGWLKFSNRLADRVHCVCPTGKEQKHSQAYFIMPLLFQFSQLLAPKSTSPTVVFCRLVLHSVVVWGFGVFFTNISVTHVENACIKANFKHLEKFLKFCCPQSALPMKSTNTSDKSLPIFCLSNCLPGLLQLSSVPSVSRGTGSSPSFQTHTAMMSHLLCGLSRNPCSHLFTWESSTTCSFCSRFWSYVRAGQWPPLENREELNLAMFNAGNYFFFFLPRHGISMKVFIVDY